MLVTQTDDIQALYKYIYIVDDSDLLLNVPWVDAYKWLMLELIRHRIIRFSHHYIYKRMNWISGAAEKLEKRREND